MFGKRLALVASLLLILAAIGTYMTQSEVRNKQALAPEKIAVNYDRL